MSRKGNVPATLDKKTLVITLGKDLLVREREAPSRMSSSLEHKLTALQMSKTAKVAIMLEQPVR